MKNPLVSIIVPTYNSSSTLRACLESIKNQTYKNIELIVVDNNSKDNTKEIAKEFTEKVFNKGPERSAQRNYGVAQSSGDYVLIIDSDMELSSKVVEECVAIFKADSKVTGIVIPEESFGVGFWAQCKKLERSFYVGVPWMEAARAFPKYIYLEVGGYDEGINGPEDWDLSQRVESMGKLSRTDAYIYHNEGHLKLIRTINKKKYYAKKFSTYQHKNSRKDYIKKQKSVLARYQLYFSDLRKLFADPFLGIGMLFMKTLEYAVGGFEIIKQNLKLIP